MELKHHGVKGMKWGVRKARSSSDVRVRRPKVRKLKGMSGDPLYYRDVESLGVPDGHAKWTHYGVGSGKNGKDIDGGYKKGVAYRETHVANPDVVQLIRNSKLPQIYSHETKKITTYSKKLLDDNGKINIEDIDNVYDKARSKYYLNQVLANTMQIEYIKD